jgi:hypothetical protein
MPAPVPSLFVFADALAPNPPHLGLGFSYYGGNILTSSGFANVPESTITLPDNSVCYVECSDSGVVSYNLVGFTPGAIVMAKVTTSGGYVLRWQDRRDIATISNTFVPNAGGGGGGGGPAARYTHVQGSAASSWTVNHNLGVYAQVAVVNNANELLLADVTYLSPNSVRIDFGRPTTGKAYLI